MKKRVHKKSKSKRASRKRQVFFDYDPLTFKKTGTTAITNLLNIPLIHPQNHTGENPRTQNLIKIHVTNHNHTLNHFPAQCEQTKQIELNYFTSIYSRKNRNHLIQIRELALDNKVDVLAISEIWLNSSILNAEVEIGYKIHRRDRKCKRGGGVCIYIRNNLKSKVLKDLLYISDVGLHKLWVQIQLNKNKSIIVCVTYNHPNCPVACIKDELQPMFIEAFRMQPQIVIMGDLNCNLLNDSDY